MTTSTATHPIQLRNVDPNAIGGVIVTHEDGKPVIHLTIDAAHIIRRVLKRAIADTGARQ